MIDRFPEGAAMDVKSLAAFNPLYKQQAVRTALNNLSAAGHLRRVRERVGADRTQWVFRTYFSRTPRGDAWWNHFIATGEPGGEGNPPEGEAADDRPPPPAEDPGSTASPSPAYRTLADLGRADRRLSLSAADCAALEPLAAAWLARGATPDVLTTALTAGLPPEVHSPAPFTRRRLIEKLPPEQPVAATAAAPPPTRVAECTDCRVPARPQALLGGLCRPCRTGGGARPVASPNPAWLTPSAVHRHAARARAGLRTGPNTGPHTGPHTGPGTGPNTRPGTGYRPRDVDRSPA
ncbi:MarR family transcriptional regulator [Kitasatospora sp. NBC_00458]|uniref:MarR family transcriptional regulator n=1 Tax=Kitasatospora sp. NBC_00458 TaxID=2903568 RepID=UPI002E1762C8